MTDFFGEHEVNTENPIAETSGLLERQDPLKIDLDDEVFADVTDDLIDKSRKFFKKKDLYDRRKRNEKYYLGLQLQELEDSRKLKKHHARYMDNVIWEAEATLKAIAMSRIPDLAVKPGSNSKESKKTAESLTEVINNEFRKRENRKVLSMAYRHRPIYFVGCIKYFWDKEKGQNGDYKFEAVHPDNIDVDHTAGSNDPQDMKWVAHHYNLSVKELFIRFPDKKKALLEELGWSQEKGNKEENMSSELKITEVWFTWYDQKEEEWQRIEGVAWKYKKLILKKMKNPNWDWKGKDILFTSGVNGEEKVIEEEDLRMALAGMTPMEDIEHKTVYYNFFEQPQKPFIFLGYDQLGKQPYDETTRIEQVIYLQENIDKRGKQITEIADNARGKNVFSTESGLEKKDIEKIDMTNPDQDILVKGEISKVWSLIPGTQPSPALFQDQEINRARAFAKMGAQATTRGEREGTETATGRQILREADYGKQDDEVESTINYAAEMMAKAVMQMIKLRYTEEHLVRILGPEGSVTFQSIDRDLVEDGMEVTVSASSVDKIQRKREAFDLAGMQMIDPLQFYEDVGATDAKERTERLMVFTMSPELYFQKYVEGRDIGDMAQALSQQPVAGGQGGGDQQQVMMDIAQLQQGQMPQPPQQLTPEYVQTIQQFIQSPEFQQLPPEIQQVAKQYAQQVGQTGLQ